MSSLAEIDNYLTSIKAQIERVPRDIALLVAQEIFQEVVEKTRIDSGQAALNWHFQPYESDVTIEGQEMMWGYGSHPPTSPAGYKWSKVDNSEVVFLYQFEYMMNQVTFAPEKLRGVMIYNPITPGAADFAPGSDEFYAQVAFERLDVNAIVESAIAKIESSYNG